MEVPDNKLVNAYAQSVKALAVIMILAAVGYFFSGFRLIQQDERAVVYSFGKMSPRPMGPGIVPALPRPFGHISIIKSTSVLVLDLSDWRPRKGTNLPTNSLHPINDGYSLTGDVNIMQGHFQLRYRITDPINWERFGAQAANSLRYIAYRNISAGMAELSVDELMSDLRSEWIRASIEGMRNDIRRLQIGIELDAFEVLDLTPPLAVRPAFDAVTTAQVEASTLLDEALTEASRINSSAVAESNVILTLARSNKEKVTLEANGWVKRFDLLSAQARIQPDVFARQFWSDTITRVLKKGRLETVLPPTGQNIRIFWKPTREGNDE